MPLHGALRHLERAGVRELVQLAKRAAPRQRTDNSIFKLDFQRLPSPTFCPRGNLPKTPTLGLGFLARALLLFIVHPAMTSIGGGVVRFSH
jgi:hypothetical protein